jgi:hypothetical protein
MFLRKLFIKLLIAVTIITASSLASGEQIFDRTFFGAHLLRGEQAGIWKQVGFGSVRLHDNNVTWADLEPIKGGWRWGHLDKLVENARSANLEILLTLEASPSWAASDSSGAGAYGPGANTMPERVEDWDAYVTAVSKRYKGVVAAYEIWNEPNLAQFFNGTPADMAKLTKRAADVIHSIDPAAKVVCSSITSDYGVSWLKKYLAAGAGQYCDVIGYHFYNHLQPPEKMLPLIASVREVIKSSGGSGKPLWNTETGWLISQGATIDYAAAGFSPGVKVLSRDDATAYIPRALLLARYAGVDRFYWYAWDHKSMGLTALSGAYWSRPARLYTDFLKLISNSKLQNCLNLNDIWSCQLHLQGGENLYVYWSEISAKSLTVTKTGDLLGIDALGEIKKLRSVKAGETLTIKDEPIFIKESL